ncbi:MAG: hypothetical protein KDA57_20110 [Planctomycetales bacterium]|nr:hypothetical protein [Planctomycetales bacterium]
MLIPRFSLRTTLLLLTVCAVFFLVMGRAYQGDYWAVVITVAVLSILATLAVHAMFYLLVLALGKLVGAKIAPARTSQGGMQSSADDLVSAAVDIPSQDSTT